MTAATIEPTSHGFSVQGDINHANASTVLHDGCDVLRSQGDASATIDLRNLASDVGSVAVALMVAWYRFATKAELEVMFTGVPNSLTKIIEFSGLTETLPVEEPMDGR